MLKNILANHIVYINFITLQNRDNFTACTTEMGGKCIGNKCL